MARDYTTKEGQQALWDLSTRVLEELTRLAKPLELPAPEACAVLMIAVGRFMGVAAFRNVSAEQAWENLTSDESSTFFRLGFNNERARES